MNLMELHAELLRRLATEMAIPEEWMTETTAVRAATPAEEADAVCQAAVEYVATYVGLKAQIAGLEEKADEAKEAALEVLGADGAPVGKVWEFPGLASVTVVKGRRTEKLNRTKLAKAGVAAEVLDACTDVTEGEPSVRIAAERE